MRLSRSPVAGMDRVGDGGRGGAGGGLAGAEEGLAPGIDQHGLEFRHVVEAEDRVGIPVAAGDAAAIEGHRLVQGPARRLDHPALELGGEPGAVDDLPRVGRDGAALQPDLRRVGHRDLDRHRRIGRDVLVARERDPAPAPLRTVRAAGVEALGRRLDHRPGARIRQMAQAKRDRIDSRLLRQLVHEGFDGEHVGVGAERAQRRDPERHAAHQVLDQPLVGQVVERVEIAVDADMRPHRRAHHRRGERVLQESGGEQARRADPVRSRARPHHEGVAEALMRPGEDPAARVHARPQVHRHAGSVGLPGVLFLARPFEHHRPAGERTGDDGGIQRRVVGAVMAVAAGPRSMQDADRPGRQVERLGERGAQEIDPLAVRDDGEPFPVELRHRRRRAERGMHLVGPLVARFEGRRGIGGRIASRRHRGLDRRAVDDGKADPLVAAQALVDVARRQPVALVPQDCGGEAFGRLHRLEFVLRGDREEAAVAHDLDAFAGEPGVHRRIVAEVARAVMRRPHHARVQHAGSAHVLQEVRPAADQILHLPRHGRGSDMAERRARLERRVRVDVDAQRLSGGELPVAGPPVGGARMDGAVIDLQRGGIDVEQARGAREQMAPRGRRGPAHRLARLGHRIAAGRDALVRREPGLGPHGLHPGEVDVELVGDEQRHRGRDALADIDLAAAHDHSLPGAEGNPVVEGGVVLEARVRRHRRPPRRAGRSPSARRHARRSGRDGRRARRARPAGRAPARYRDTP